MNKIIIVNATALHQGGALTILKQFLYNVPKDDFQYIVFIPKNVAFNFQLNNNLTLIPMDVKGVFKRLYWDLLGLKKWLKDNKIQVFCTISLQNTNFKIGKKVPNFIYYHQPTPLFFKNWNPLKKNEQRLWFYKNIYPLMVKLTFNSRTHFIVQLQFVKDGFSKLYNIEKKRIMVIEPTIETIEVSNESKIELNTNDFNIYYPAAAFVYKNHYMLFKALHLAQKQSKTKIVLHLTGCLSTDFVKKQLEKHKDIKIVFWGKVPFYDVIGLYKKSDLLVFPSYIETFGLPLTEAASFGLPIIAADLPYAREVLNGYKAIDFVQFDNPNSWKEIILKRISNKNQRFEIFSRPQGDSWLKMFENIKIIINS